MAEDNVVQLFKHVKKDTKFDELELQLQGLQRVLDKQYGLVKHRLEQLQAAETGAAQLEEKYDRLLLDYAKRKGAENVEIAYLNYTTRVRLSYDIDGNLVVKYDGEVS